MHGHARIEAIKRRAGLGYRSTASGYLLYKAEKPSVCLSVLIFWHADISVVSASIETGLARNESCVIEED